VKYFQRISEFYNFALQDYKAVYKFLEKKVGFGDKVITFPQKGYAEDVYICLPNGII